MHIHARDTESGFLGEGLGILMMYVDVRCEVVYKLVLSDGGGERRK